ncbi:hypothetical protein ACH46_17020 [Gordonia phthalatica]|uniref:Uncharacterized protein n=1 Tax=Gordonia phthalatica TaxID=1136941 RepID=A0A0N9N4W7_9ACTN|nr:hypothetical protein [Gordonia phthalatica]ALG85875.1 hypothetical protein ACH46_17020 [Gordonia phthalatica]
MIEVPARQRPPRPDPRDRPTQVVWALRLWMIAGGLLIALGAFGVVADAVSLGFDFGVLALDFLIAILGVVYLLLGAKTYRGAVQWRSSLSALTCVVVAMLLPLTIGFQSAGLAIVLAVAVVGLFGSVLAYRPPADRWFKCKLGDCPPEDPEDSDR